MLYRNLNFKTKDIDKKEGIVSFYFSDFSTVDNVGDRVDSKAFDKTLRFKKEQVHHLLNHDIFNIVGKVQELGTDSKGAYCVSKMSKTQLGQDTLTLYEEGVYNQHSFGYEVSNSHKDGDIRILTEIKLYEVSTVPFGANPNTPTIDVKQLDKLLRNNDLSEQLLEKLDLVLKQLVVEKTPVQVEPVEKKQDNSYQLFMNAINDYKINHK